MTAPPLTAGPVDRDALTEAWTAWLAGVFGPGGGSESRDSYAVRAQVR
jgi:hypothetical protein